MRSTPAAHCSFTLGVLLTCSALFLASGCGEPPCAAGPQLCSEKLVCDKNAPSAQLGSHNSTTSNGFCSGGSCESVSLPCAPGYQCAFPDYAPDSAQLGSARSQCVPESKVCGGTFGDCAPDEFCEYVGVLCSFVAAYQDDCTLDACEYKAAGGLGTCKVKPTVCSGGGNAVEDCQGNTYRNDCERQMAGETYARPSFGPDRGDISEMSDLDQSWSVDASFGPMCGGASLSHNGTTALLSVLPSTLGAGRLSAQGYELHLGPLPLTRRGGQ